MQIYQYFIHILNLPYFFRGKIDKMLFYIDKSKF